MQDIKDLIAKSDEQFASLSDERIFNFSHVRPHYLQCAEKLEYIALCCDHEDEDNNLMCVHLRMHALMLLENWLCAIVDAYFSRQPLSLAERDIVRTMKFDCSTEYVRSRPLTGRSSFMFAATCLMITAKYQLDAMCLCSDALHAKRNFNILKRRGLRCDAHYVYTFLNNAALRVLNDAGKNVDNDALNALSMTTMRQVQRRAHRIEFDILTRLDWRVNLVTDTQFVETFCDNVATFLSEAHCKWPQHNLRDAKRKIRVFSYVFLTTARTQSLAGHAGGIAQCWINALCAVLVACKDILPDARVFAYVERRMHGTYVPQRDDSSFVKLHCRRLYKALRDNMNPVFERFTPEKSERKRCARDAASIDSAGPTVVAKRQRV